MSELIQRFAVDGLGEIPSASSIQTPMDAKRYLKRYQLQAFHDASDSDSLPAEEEEEEEEEGSDADPEHEEEEEEEEEEEFEEEEEEEGLDDLRDPSSPQATRDMSEGEEDDGRCANSDFSHDA